VKRDKNHNAEITQGPIPAHYTGGKLPIGRTTDE
jgi:hypothetical protein